MPDIKTKYKPLYFSDKRYFILTGGRGSGKTFVVQDYLVRLLEEVYLEIRPWVKPHPNIGVHCDGSVCPTCGSDDIEDNGKYYTTNTNKYQSFRCNGCGALSRSIDSQLSLDERKDLMRPLP